MAQMIEVKHAPQVFTCPGCQENWCVDCLTRVASDDGNDHYFCPRCKKKVAYSVTEKRIVPADSHGALQESSVR